MVCKASLNHAIYAHNPIAKRAIAHMHIVCCAVGKTEHYTQTHGWYFSFQILISRVCNNYEHKHKTQVQHKICADGAQEI